MCIVHHFIAVKYLINADIIIRLFAECTDICFTRCRIFEGGLSELFFRNAYTYRTGIIKTRYRCF